MDVSAPRVSPAASRRWVALERARNAHRSSVASPTAIGSSASGRGDEPRAAPAAAAGRRPGATVRCCARRGGGPWRWTSPGRPRRGRGPAARGRRRRRPRRTPAAPCIVSIGRTVMPALSMSTNRAVMPLCADSGVPVRVSSTQRCAYWARLVHTFWPLILQPSSVARRPAGERGQVAAGPGLGEALAPDLLAAQQPGHHLGRQGCGRVVDHRRRQDLGHGVDAGLDEIARRERLSEVGAEQVGAAQPTDALGPSHAHEPGVVGQPHHLAELCHLLVEGPDALVGGGELARVRVQPVVDGCLEVVELHGAGRLRRRCRPRVRAGSGRAAFPRRAHRCAGGRSWTGFAAASPVWSAGTCRCSSRCACHGSSGRRSRASAVPVPASPSSSSTGVPVRKRPFGAAATSSGKSSKA